MANSLENAFYLKEFVRHKAGCGLAAETADGEVCVWASHRNKRLGRR